MLEQLDDYNWAEVFGEGSSTYNCPPLIPSVIPFDTCSAEAFGREDVALIKGQKEGENDCYDWIVWGQLKDERWFVARGDCGWDCQASNGANVASNQVDLVRFGMTTEERNRFGLGV